MTLKFGAGQRVMIRRTSANSAPEGRYKIIRVMPKSGPITFYRVKSEVEQFERVVDEASIVEYQD